MDIKSISTKNTKTTIRFMSKMFISIMGENMKNKVYITGVCGTVGFELAKYYIDKGFCVIGVDINENEIVVVDKVLNSENVKRFIFLSSDEAYNPVNFFGKDKLEVEEVIRTVNSNDKIVQAVRFPFILESKGSVFHIFRNQAKNDLPLTVTHKDIKKIATDIKSFIDIWAEFDDKILENGIFNFEIGREIYIYELAMDIIKDMKSSSNIVISGLREGEVLDRKIIKSNEEKIYDRIFKLN